MGAIKVHEFTTVDGVVDAPTWAFDFGFPRDMAADLAALTASSSGILLGRTTFEMFAPAWSARTVEDDPGAPFFNGARKYVVSSTLGEAQAEAAWSNSTVIGSYATARLRALKRGLAGDLYVSGSATLVRALLTDGLVDELHLFVYPLAVGAGTRLFRDGGARMSLSLLDARCLSNGVAHLTYGPEVATAGPPAVRTADQAFPPVLEEAMGVVGRAGGHSDDVRPHPPATDGASNSRSRPRAGPRDEEGWS